MKDRSERATLFFCKPCLTVMLPYVLAGTAVLVLFALFGAWLPGAVVCGAVIIFKYAAVNSAEVTVTDLYVKVGKQTVPFGKITGVDCTQSFSGKIFGYGAVVIRTSDKKLIIRGIPQAETLRNEISKQTDLYHFNRTCRQAEHARELMEKGL